MAVPTNARVLRPSPLKAGVMLGVSPSSDPTFDVEIARATSSGVYSTQGRLTAQGGGVPVVFTDILPMSSHTYSYKARAVKDGWNPGDYTSVVSVKPVLLPAVAPNVTPLTGKAIAIPLYVSTGQRITFGSPAVPATYTRRLRIASPEFVGATSTTPYGVNAAGYIYPNSSGGTTGSPNFFYAPVLVPPTANITQFKYQGYRGTTAAYVELYLWQATTAGAVAAIGNKKSTGVNITLVTSSALNASASTSYSYFLELRMKTGSATKTNARLYWVDMSYTVGNLQASL